MGKNEKKTNISELITNKIMLRDIRVGLFLLVVVSIVISYVYFGTWREEGFFVFMFITINLLVALSLLIFTMIQLKTSLAYRAQDLARHQEERAEDKANLERMFETLCTILTIGKRPKIMPDMELREYEELYPGKVSKKSSLLVLRFKDNVPYQTKISQVENMTMADYEAIIHKFNEKK